MPLIRRIAAISDRYGFSVALYGSVMTHGQSPNDLDLFFVLQNPEIANRDGCLNEIATLPEICHLGAQHETTTAYCAVIWLRDGKYIDAQFLH